MRVRLYVKDFTWGTLNDPEVRRKIEDANPIVPRPRLREAATSSAGKDRC